MFLTRSMVIFPVQTSPNDYLHYASVLLKGQEGRKLGLGEVPQHQKRSVKKDLNIFKVSPFLLPCEY